MAQDETGKEVNVSVNGGQGTQVGDNGTMIIHNHTKPQLDLSAIFGLSPNTAVERIRSVVYQDAAHAIPPSNNC